MASINGITVKALKEFKGHEGEPLYQGNIYLDNKKIGWWSQDSHGGCDHIYLDAQYSLSKLENKVNQMNLDYSLDLLFGDLVIMQSDEKDFKNAVKSGYAGVLLITDGYHIFGWNLPKTLTAMPNDEIIERFSQAIEDGKKEHKFFKENAYTKHEIKIYRTSDDFKVGRAISLNDIVR